MKVTSSIEVHCGAKYDIWKKWFLSSIHQPIFCQRHKQSQEQKLKDRSKFNFQIRIKTRLCDSKTRTQELKKRIWDVQNKHENIILLS